MMTVWAGKLTPQARVAVHTRTLSKPSANSFSLRVRSLRSMPAASGEVGVAEREGSSGQRQAREVRRLGWERRFG